MKCDVPLEEDCNRGVKALAAVGKASRLNVLRARKRQSVYLVYPGDPAYPVSSVVVASGWMMNTPEIRNKKAFHDYEIIDSLEAGIVLTGPEVKSVREGRVSLRDTHVSFESGQPELIGMQVSAYKNAGYREQHPIRPRRLLMHKRELKKWARRAFEKGFTVVPLKVYFNDRGYAKVEIALARGKREYDKRKAIAEREVKRDLARAKKEANR